MRLFGVRMLKVTILGLNTLRIEAVMLLIENLLIDCFDFFISMQMHNIRFLRVLQGNDGL